MHFLGVKVFWTPKSLFQGSGLYFLSKWQRFCIWHVNYGKRLGNAIRVKNNGSKTTLKQTARLFEMGQLWKIWGSVQTSLWNWEMEILHFCRAFFVVAYVILWGHFFSLSLFCSRDPNWPLAHPGVSEALYLKSSCTKWAYKGMKSEYCCSSPALFWIKSLTEMHWRSRSLQFCWWNAWVPELDRLFSLNSY